MVRDRKRPLKIYVTEAERAAIAARAQSCGLVVSDYLRAVGLGHEPRSIFDHEAVMALAKVNADQGRLGGLAEAVAERTARPGRFRHGRAPPAARDRGGPGGSAQTRGADVIAKRVARDKASSSFGRLAEYIAEEEARPQGQPQEAGDPLTWAKTASSILDAENDGGRVGAVRVTNCVSEEPGFAAREIAETQKRNRRSKADKTYHLVVSFPPGERPTPEQLRDIEDSLCAAIGLADHQRLSAVHLDTACLHIHVAINKVHPTTFRNVEPRYDKRKLMQACGELEIKHGLARANHGEAAKKGPAPIQATARMRVSCAGSRSTPARRSPPAGPRAMAGGSCTPFSPNSTSNSARAARAWSSPSAAAG